MHGYTRFAVGGSVAILLSLASCQKASGPTPLVVTDEDFSTAQVTVQTVTDKLEKNDPSVLWRAMPQRWRSEVQELVHLAAKKVDAELYDAVFDVARLGVQVLREKRDLILQQRELRMMAGFFVKGGADGLAKVWDSVLAPLETLLASELAEHESFAKIDLERYLHSTGSTLLAQIKSIAANAGGRATKQLSELRFQSESEEGDMATLRVYKAGKKGKAVKMTRVDDRWVPIEMAQSFDRDMAKARAKVEAFRGDKHSKGVLAQLSKVRAVLKQLLATDSPDEFQAVLDMLKSKSSRARPGR